MRANIRAAPVQPYKAVAKLNEPGLNLPNGRCLDVTPGMALTAGIHQNRGAVIECPLSRVRRVALEAGTER